MKSFLVFFVTLAGALLVQSFIWQHFPFVDREMWANQARYVQTGDPRQFDVLAAYGHPGTTLVELTILLHNFLGASYVDALLGAMTVLGALAIAGCAVVCYRLRPTYPWWWMTAIVLSFNTMYPTATPPSAIVSPLIVLIVLLALFLYEQASFRRWPGLVLWGLVIGSAAATRLDVTVAVSAPLLILLLSTNRLKWSEVGTVLAATGLTFFVLNPFMWFMPRQHILGLISKIVFHYGQFADYRVPLPTLLLISPSALLSVALAAYYSLRRKAVVAGLPRLFIGVLLLLTIAIIGVLFSSHFQAQRYFYPLAFVWEVFLLLFLWDFVLTGSRWVRLLSLCLLALMVTGHIAALLHLILIPQTMFLCLNHRAFLCSASVVIVW